MSEHTIYVNKVVTGEKYWIKIHRNNQYIPFHYPIVKNTNTNTNTKSHREEPDEWRVVQNKKKLQKVPNDQPIYYWVVSSHNMFDISDQSYRLFFTEPDITQIEHIDQNNYMAIDTDNQLRLIHIHLKHKGMKMTPTYYIARNVKQIVDALSFVKYCIVKTDNNEQKLIELT